MGCGVSLQHIREEQDKVVLMFCEFLLLDVESY